MHALKLPLLAVLIAIAVTTTMDFTGFTMFSSLPLLAIIISFWLIQRLSKKEIGLTFGPLKYYGLALLYPILVLGITALVAYLYGDFSTVETDWTKTIKNIAAGSLIGPLMVLLTEEGFFRGWLWGSFRKSGMSVTKTLIVTSILFTLWHVSAVTSGTEYGLPMAQVPIYLINATLLGLIWGMLRLISNSVFVPAVCHAVWNALAYALFGFGEKVGDLGVIHTNWFGPEVGYLGIILNGAFFFWLWMKFRKHRSPQTKDY
jgi:membrane protease YdiL (CAAX protease family)